MRAQRHIERAIVEKLYEEHPSIGWQERTGRGRSLKSTLQGVLYVLKTLAGGGCPRTRVQAQPAAKYKLVADGGGACGLVRSRAEGARGLSKTRNVEDCVSTVRLD